MTNQDKNEQQSENLKQNNDSKNEKDFEKSQGSTFKGLDNLPPVPPSEFLNEHDNQSSKLNPYRQSMVNTNDLQDVNIDERKYEVNTNPPFKATALEAYEINRTGRLRLAANITGFVSVLFGSVLLSIIGLVAGYVTYRRYDAIGKNHPEDPRIRQELLKKARTPLWICGIALVINIVILIYFFPMIMEAAQTGDMSYLFNAFNGASTGAGGGSGSVWG